MAKFLLLLYFPFVLQAQDSSLRGQVRDAQTQEPLVGAAVQLLEPRRSSTQTDAKGNYQFTALAAGSYTLRVRYVGYASQTLQVQVQGGATQDIALAASATQTEEIVLTAVRGSSTTPLTQVTLQRADIERSYYGQDISYQLARTPNINLYSDDGTNAGYTYMRLRGMDQTRINVTLEGAPLNEPEDQLVFFTNFPDFANSIHNVQVQRGVGTSTFGTASYAGSLNYQFTPLADTAARGELQMSLGSFGTQRYAAEYNTGLLPSKWAAYGRVSYFRTDGYRYNAYSYGTSALASVGYFGERDVVKLIVLTGRTLFGMSYLPSSEAAIAQDRRHNPLTPDEINDNEQHFAYLQYSHRFSDQTQVLSGVYYTRYAGYFDIRFDATTLLKADLLSDFYGGMLALNHKPGAWQLTLGTHANTYRRDHFAGFRPNITQLLYRNTGDKQEGTVFGKASYTAGKWQLYADVQYRLSRFSYQPDANSGVTARSIDWSFLNPKVGASYQLQDAQQLYVSFGSTGREPARLDMFAGNDDLNSGNEAEIGDFARVRPERVYDWELGYKLNRSSINLEVNGFYMLFENEITPIGQIGLLSGLPLRKNVASSYRAGIELDAQYKPLQQLVVAGNLTWNHHRIREYTNDATAESYYNVAPTLTPAWLGNLRLIYMPQNRWDIELSLRYVSKQYLDNTGNDAYVTPAFTRMDGRVGYRMRRGPELALVLNNLTNAVYYTAGQVTAGNVSYFVTPPLNAMFTMKWTLQ